MPYRKKYVKKSYGHSRPGYVRCGKMVMSDASKALAMAKYLKSIVNVEFKHLTQSQTNLGVPDGVGAILQLTNIAQGDSTTTRDGSNIKIVSIGLEYTVAMHASATQSVVRVMFLHDRQTNQVLYSTADVLEDVTVIDSVTSPRNLHNGSRFQVLYDKRHVLSISGAQIVSGRFHKKVQIKLRYDANAGTIADLTQSSLSLLLISNEATNVPLFAGFIRLRFVDN